MCPGLPPTDGARDFLILFYANISFVKYTLDCPNAVAQIIIARLNMIVLIIFYCFYDYTFLVVRRQKFRSSDKCLF